MPSEIQQIMRNYLSKSFSEGAEDPLMGRETDDTPTSLVDATEKDGERMGEGEEEETSVRTAEMLRDGSVNWADEQCLICLEV